MSSYQVGAVCYGSELEAAQAVASAQGGMLVPLGGGTASVSVGAVTGSSISYTLTPLGVGSAITQTTPYTPLPCGLMDTAEGAVLGGAILVVWVSIAAINVLRRGVHE